MRAHDLDSALLRSAPLVSSMHLKRSAYKCTEILAENLDICQRVHMQKDDTIIA